MLLRDGYISHIFTLLFGIAVLSSVFAGAQKPGSCLTYQNVLHFLESASLDYFPNRDGDATELFPMSPCGGLVIEEASLDQLQDALHNGSTTSVQLLWCYLERIHQVEEYVTAIMQFNPDALEIAIKADQERENGKNCGPLHGVPYLLKDNFATKDRMETTAGSWSLLGSIVPRDAYVVDKLRAAGAVLLGKATMSEWASMRSNNYSEGYSARGGQPRSPYNFTVNPGGSSTGPAIAVSANLIPFALGTETDGSIINPAMRNAVVGIKPTVGLTSRGGVVPESSHQDSVGPFGKTVRDATYVLDVIYGVDERDNYTAGQVGSTPEGGYAQYLTGKEALKGAKFGLPWQSFWEKGDPQQIEQLVELLELIESAGATIYNGTEIPNFQTIVANETWDWDWGNTRGFPNESEYTVVKVDFYNDIQLYLSELENTDIRTLEDIVQYNVDNYGSEGGYPDIHPAFGSGQDGLLASLETGGVQDETYFQALGFVQRTTREEGIDAALQLPDGTVLDGLLAPPDVGQSYQIAAQAGYPVVTVPAGVNEVSRMPYGLSITGTAWSEASLIKWASAIEDLQKSTDTPYKRTKPEWNGYLQRNLPVINA